MGKLTHAELKREYPERGCIVSKCDLGGTPLLQENYGKEMDCTLTSMAFIFGEQYYDLIEKTALRYWYNGDKGGTNPAAICAIMRKVMQALEINGTPKHAYCKGMQYNYEKIKKLIDERHYVLLNLLKDGRDYYANHTVTIIGYLEYDNNRFLTVYDNWNAEPCYIDYDKLSWISSINWYEVKHD